MSQDKKIQVLQRNFLAKRIELRKLEARYEKFLSALRNLNAAHSARQISYKDYIQKWEHYLGEYSLEQWKQYYQQQADLHYDELLKIQASLNVEREAVKKSDAIAVTTLSLVAILLLVAGISLSGIVPSITGFASQTAESETQVTISEYYAIYASDNLVDGIAFGSLIHNTQDNAATDNANGGGSGSTLYLESSSDSNIDLALCIKASDDLVNITNSIPTIIKIGNLTWANDTSTDSGTPKLAFETEMTKSYVHALNLTTSVPDIAYFRFWLDVPNAQPALQYNNTLYFYSMKEGDTCP